MNSFNAAQKLFETPHLSDKDPPGWKVACGGLEQELDKVLPMTQGEEDEHLKIAQLTHEKPPDEFNVMHFSKMYQGGAVSYPDLKPFMNILCENGKSSALLANLTHIPSVDEKLLKVIDENLRVK